MCAKVSDKMEAWCNLEGKVVMVTGASSGLGREFCLDLTKAGCKVVAAARRMDRLHSLCQQINCTTTNCQAAAVELDLMASGPAIKLAVEKAWELFGRIDALVNNAGFRGGVNSSLDISEEEWKKVVQTNMTGPWLVSKYIGQLMQGRGQGGCIINISSVSALNRSQMHGTAAYSSSKAGLDSMTKIMALELGKYDIRVNSIAPGLFQSEITENLFKRDWLKSVAEKTVPLQRYGTIDPALTSLVRYLIHDASKYITGNTFIVDGGNTLPGVPIFSSL